MMSPAKHLGIQATSRILQVLWGTVCYGLIFLSWFRMTIPEIGEEDMKSNSIEMKRSLRKRYALLTPVVVWLGIVLMSSVVFAGNNEWTAQGPYGGSINSMVIDPTNSQTIYAATDGGGVFKTTNSGGTWVPVNSGITNAYVVALTVDPANGQNVYAGTNGGGIFKTINGGNSWVAVNAGLVNASIDAITIDPTNSQTLYAVTKIGGIFKSTNGGTDWSVIDSGTRVSIAIDPTNSQVIYAGSYSGSIYKTTNGGTSWVAVNIGLTNGKVHTLCIDPTNSQIVYAGTYGGGVFKTTNGGTTWTAVNTGITNSYVLALALDPTDAQTVYAGTGGGIFKSSNGGAGWVESNSGLTNVNILSVVINPINGQSIYAGTEGGVFKTVNGGTEWGDANSGIIAAKINTVAITANGQYMYTATNGGVYKTIDGGSTWSLVNSGITNTYVPTVAIDPIQSGVVYAGTFGGGVFKTTDAGATWLPVNDGLANKFVLSMVVDPLNSQTVYVGTNGGGAFKTMNGGGSWAAVNSGLSNVNVLSLAIDAIDSQVIYAGTFQGGIYRTSNGGTTWTTVNTGLTDPVVLALAIDPTNSQIVYAATFHGVYKSINSGGNWGEVLAGVSVDSLAIDPGDSRILYAGTSGGGVFRSTDGGGSWGVTNNGLTTGIVKSVIIGPRDSGIVYAGTWGGGVFSMTLPLPIVNGVCGNANSTAVSAKPTSNLCADNSMPEISGNGPWSWTCNGSHGGIDATCSAAVIYSPRAVISGIPASPIKAGTYSLSIGGEKIVAYKARLTKAGVAGSWPKAETPVASKITIPCSVAGEYKVEVIGRDSLGAWQGVESATVAAWTIDTTPPQTILGDIKPAPLSTETTPSFSFSSEEGATFECKVDRAPFVPCSSPFTAATLSDGRHSFMVRAKDSAGNYDLTPATYSWTIDTKPPVFSIYPLKPTNLTQIAISGTKEVGSTLIKTSPDSVTCTFSLKTTKASKTWSCIAEGYDENGTTTIEFAATDNAGNQSMRSVNIVHDSLPPDGTILVKGTESTDTYSGKVSVGLMLSCNGTGSDCSYMRFKNGEGKWSVWEAYKSSKLWKLSAANAEQRVWAEFKDAAGNVSATAIGDNIILDTIAPKNGVLAATQLEGNKIKLDWSGFSDSGSNIASYKLIRGISVPATCSGNSIAPLTSSDTMYVDSGAEGVTYHYRLCAVDSAGNVSTGVTAKARAIPEITKPTGTVLINSGATSTNKTAVTLEIYATDASRITGYCISNSSSCKTWTTIPGVDPLSIPVKGWTLVGGASGERTVTVWFRDAWGNVSEPVVDGIRFDTAQASVR